MEAAINKIVARYRGGGGGGGADNSITQMAVMDVSTCWMIIVVMLNM